MKDMEAGELQTQRPGGGNKLDCPFDRKSWGGWGKGGYTDGDFVSHEGSPQAAEQGSVMLYALICRPLCLL